tara:strand:- start:295 stop:549 length:255 start_codon:yes stop_codon:yes gene_type:complete
MVGVINDNCIIWIEFFHLTLVLLQSIFSLFQSTSHINFSTHMRKTKPSVIYEQTHNADAVRRLLGQSSVTSTSAYLGVSDNSAL